ncbi:hypothetical protein [Streptomyces sp. NPDC002994]|uniref:hypothetical protein n=1 Tax=Streptomyces sp. NPDC002994 TaxID=3154441 RepID=UPI0033B2A42F
MNDFDFFNGDWNVRNRILTDFLDPDSGWSECEGSTRVQPLFGGAAQVDEITFPSRGFSGLTLRLYDQEREEWTLNWVNSRTGRLEPPVTGRFGADGRGVFVGDDTYGGKDVRVRFVWSGISATTARWEQAFSVDGEKTWLTNWVMDFTRRA